MTCCANLSLGRLVVLGVPEVLQGAGILPLPHVEHTLNEGSECPQALSSSLLSYHSLGYPRVQQEVVKVGLCCPIFGPRSWGVGQEAGFPEGLKDPLLQC